MQDDSSISDDPGTILDSYASVPRALPATEEVLYRSPYRWAAPQILICDDGSLDEGETFYVRSDKIVIGRITGDIAIGHDIAMSGSHAEIARRDAGGEIAWVLRDLGSSNGTFVRVSKVTLKPGITIQLGSKRYRFEVPGAPQVGTTADSADPGTAMLTTLQALTTDLLPALVEHTMAGGGQPVRLPFRATRLTIGRPGRGNHIELDDLCLAGLHAIATRDVSGVWKLESQPSLNGIWVKVNAIPLKDNCHFQCGEQRFRFQL